MEYIVKAYKPQEDTLKPCPFCSSKEIVFLSYKTKTGLRWKVMCLDCMASIDPGWVQEMGYLWGMWNRRAVGKEESYANVIIPKDNIKLDKQIAALEWQLKHDTSPKDKKIHQVAYNRLVEERRKRVD